jgi:hypothetical protein
MEPLAGGRAHPVGPILALLLPCRRSTIFLIIRFILLEGQYVPAAQGV